MSSIQHPYTQVGQSETFELQPLISVGASPSFKGIVVHEGDEPRSFADEDELKRYLGQYPEAENDQATRLFQYTPECPPRLLVALFEKFEFSRFSMVPKGAAGEILRTTGLGTGQCKCDKCKTGGFCGYYALEFAISFWQYHGTSIDAENRLEVTGNDTLFAIYGGGQ
jgi:hypothetical protein